MRARPTSGAARRGAATSALALVLALASGSCGGDEEPAPLSPDDVQRQSLEEVWGQGNDRARTIICKEFAKDPEAFARDFTKVGKDSVVLAFFEEKC